MTGSGKLIQSSYQASFVLSDNLSTFQILAVLNTKLRTSVLIYFSICRQKGQGN